MTPIFQWQFNRSLDPVRFVYRQDHLQGRTPIVHASKRLTVVLDSLDQILNDPNIPLGQATVMKGLGFAQACAGYLLPMSLASAGKPGGVFQEVGAWQAPGGELDDPFGP